MNDRGHEVAGRAAATAALRAAVAWTKRDVEPDAWRELSRMTGVVMNHLGPGQGPSSPVDLVEFLRHPLGKLLGAAAGPGALADLVLLDADDQLTDAAVEVGCEYTEALFSAEDPGRRWLPAWAWQRAEQVQRRVFENLVRSGGDAEYTAARRFLIEHPAGDARELRALLNKEHVPRVAEFTPIPADRVWRSDGGPWWWPCPVCEWPMTVRQDVVRCGYSPHEAQFRVDKAAQGPARPPRLLKLSSARMPVPRARLSEGAQRVELAVWRFVTVPGIPELDLERRLLKIPGVAVSMWPGKDRFDLAVRVPDGRAWEVDVKDHADPASIVGDPPFARDIVVPNYRRSQVGPLARALPGKRIWTISGFERHVSAQLAGAAR